MTTTVLKRQFITDAEGEPVAVILPIEEYARVKDYLDSMSPARERRSTRGQRSVREAPYFGLWSERHDLRSTSSREWLNHLRSEQWKRQ